MNEEIENMEMPSMELPSMELPLNKDERRNLKTLKRRRDYLDTIIEVTDEDALSLSYDKAERSALNWAINFIEKRI